MVIILTSWGENYGDASENKSLLSQFKGTAVAIASDEKIALLGAIQSLFEGSMYTFVFLWPPALSPNDEDIPHGFIFATFMVSSMLGSSIASRLLARATDRVESYMQIVFGVSAFTLMLPVITNFLVAPSTVKGGSISLGGCIQLFGFCTFEACVGIFWPSIMKMRSQHIPEEARSTIMNFFRIPLNIFVCIVLYNVNVFPITVMFGMCSIFLFMASILQRRLMLVSETHRSSGNLTGRSYFVGVLCACARACLLTEGKQYFSQIPNLYNLTPSFAHYWCMANLYGALGFVQEAENVLRVMPKETYSSLLSSLFGLSGYRGDIELGERIAKRLIELEPKNCSRYGMFT